jgi:hypothetical protein
MDHERSRNLPHSFKLSPGTFTAMCLHVLQWHKSIYFLQQAITQLGIPQWTHWRRAVATTWMYRGILELYPYYSGYFRSFLCPVRLCESMYVCAPRPSTIYLSESKHMTPTPVYLSTYLEQVTVRTRAPEAIRTVASRHEVQKHRLLPFDMTTIVLPCKMGESCVQNPVPGINPKESSELRTLNFINISDFI